MITRSRVFLVLPLCLVFVVGCSSGPKNAPARVSGSITYNGKRITAGTIRFHSDATAIYNGTIHPDGTYSAVDIPSGETVVTIETESVALSQNKQNYGAGIRKEGTKMFSPAPKRPQVKAPAGEYVKIPEKYANPRTSDLIITLGKGRQTKNLELKD